MKAFIISFTFLLLTIFGYHYSKQIPQESKEQLEYGGVLWPKSSRYEMSNAGDISISLAEDFSAFQGHWSIGTLFKFDGDKLAEIQTLEGFQFAELEFKHKTKIVLEDFPPFILHVFHLEEEMQVDGLDLKPGCKIQFKDYVLYAAQCEDFGVVYFKRSVDLPENAKIKNE